MPAKDFTPERQSVPVVSIVAGLAVLFGIGAFSYGFWLAWHPLGFIVGGLSASAVGVLLGRKAGRPGHRSVRGQA
jgi:hypothetical protein